MRSDIVPDGIFLDFSLPDQTGTVRSLSELQGRDPMILTLARGHYCPKEHQQHLELAAFQSRIAVAYTTRTRLCSSRASSSTASTRVLVLGTSFAGRVVVRSTDGDE